jgi:hypothetical protein
MHSNGSFSSLLTRYSFLHVLVEWIVIVWMISNLVLDANLTMYELSVVVLSKKFYEVRIN